ncbi:hypothetical protein ABPG75_012732 [Micractinium tetrahymenae]
MAPAAEAGPFKYTADLTGGSSVPPVESKATGTFDITCTENPSDHAKDSCSWTLTVRGIQDMGGPTENGPVIEATAPADNALPMLSPTVSGDKEFKGTFGNAGLGGPARGMMIDDVRAGVASGKIQAYVNVHTMAHPAGEIRGQIKKA